MDIKNISHTVKKVHYAIRGPILQEALRLEEAGEEVLKLNIGNTFPFGIEADTHVLEYVRDNIALAQGYVESKGLLTSREAVAHYYAYNYNLAISPDSIFLGNGVSELISLSMSAFINPGDEILVPSPDYPLWSAMIHLNHGTPVYYSCDIENDWMPRVEDIKKLISNKTRAIVIISPNNPTGAVYSKTLLQQIINIAIEHQLLIFSDEIYERIVYDTQEPCPIATLMNDVPCIFFNGISKTYRAPGFRCGWMCIYDPKNVLMLLKDAIEKLSSLRLCSNVIAQLSLQAVFQQQEHIDALMKPKGIFYERVQAACTGLSSIAGIRFMPPKGTMYIFPQLLEEHAIQNGEQFVLDFLREKHVLLVPASGFNYHKENFFRIVCLAPEDTMREAMLRLKDFLQSYRQR